MQTYLRGGSIFRVKDQKWRGHVVFSPDFIFCVPITQAGLLYATYASAVLSLGGRLDGFVKITLPRKAELPEGMERGDIAKMAPAIVKHHDWPLKPWKKGRLLLIRKSLVTAMKLPSFSKRLTVTTATHEFEITLSRIKVGSVRSFLQAHGWPLGE